MHVFEDIKRLISVGIMGICICNIFSAKGMSKVIEIKVILKTKCQKKKFSFKAKINQQPKNEKKETQHIVILKQNYYKD